MSSRIVAVSSRLEETRYGWSCSSKFRAREGFEGKLKTKANNFTAREKKRVENY